jgi:hypothetical protein
MSASHRPTMASSLPSLSPLGCAGERLESQDVVEFD